ncbi:holo-ACP synthase [Desulfuromonas acetoxidans]|uniref:Holo-[acyl-carrier-protein] synthase n=1 Tax=Desulfuromonas acetoxidans (strain DSM 684 / 11070) TaxID=281689 RepID=Q1JY27_DESA6|nr:holo-ACP synthase [Desulfuromonas acetoxidans]EAT15169.1 phosphopantethiene--protein transferase domain [Desulfuromonas acetoxidans DSM 684]MBF0643996.1 holo-ACP synthase [Desulfuromonas acetoxidans]NVD23234.1 holo-ACP synthase [Desulfuromonas acetoxidans]NVE15525.1 holo-ACP synthase [Desulfuromonas acetoxidans]
MAIAGIGTDIVDVERFDRFIDEDNQTLLQRLFTPGELDYALPRKCAAQHLAARFACKEAFVKALGLGMRDGMTWHDIEVVRDELGCPSLALSGRAAEIFEQRQLCAHHVSYSHETRWAVATVIVEES